MNLYDNLKKFFIGFITGLFSEPDPDGLKAERIQFWEDVVPDWKRDGNALVRRFTSSGALAAGEMSTTVVGVLEEYGYHPDVTTDGNAVTVRLATPLADRPTERDYATAALIDLTF